VATYLSLDPKLIEEAVKIRGERTGKAAVTRALEEYRAAQTEGLFGSDGQTGVGLIVRLSG
jgi:hypothetical protein